MNGLLPGSRPDRREFLRDGLRFAILGGLAALSCRLFARPRIVPHGETCINAGICGDCEALDDCGLPRALSVKASLEGSHET